MTLRDACSSRVPFILLSWYIGLLIAMSIAPVDPKVWYAQNILPVAFAGMLAATHRRFPLSSVSYLFIAGWLTLHTIAVHYTYPKVPFGFWLADLFHFQRNHFDRIVHFSFGLLLTYPLHEAFGRCWTLTRRQLDYLVVMTVLGVSALWEIFEAWLGQLAHADLEKAFVGHQGDVWDPQRDMASALYGALVCLLLMGVGRWLARSEAALEPAVESTSPTSLSNV